MIESLDILEIDEAISRLQDELTITTNSPRASEILSSKNIEEKEIEKTFNLDKKDELKTLEKPQEKGFNEKKLKEKEELDKDLNGESKFKNLVDKIYDRNYDLGEVFSRCVEFVSFKNNVLTWQSTADGDDKKILIHNWSIIKVFVEEVFGIGVKIEALQKKKLNINKKENKTDSIDAKDKSIEQVDEQKSSCIMPDGNSEASIDKNPQDLLKEPMIKSFLEIFEPKRVVVKQKT